MAPHRRTRLAAGPARPGHPTPLPLTDYYRRVAGTLYGGQARHDPDALLHGSIVRFAQAPTVGGYAAQLYAVSFWTGLPWLWCLRQATLVLTGEDEPVVPVVNGRILARLIPNARLEIIRGGGHLFLLEQPAQHAQPDRRIPQRHGERSAVDVPTPAAVASGDGRHTRRTRRHAHRGRAGPLRLR